MTLYGDYRHLKATLAKIPEIRIMCGLMATAKTDTKKTAAKKAAPKKTAAKAAVDAFAVIKTGGKQYKVAPGDTITIEKINDELKKGDKVTFGEVLLTVSGDSATFGTPFIDKASVSGEIVSVGRAQKVTVIKYKQKSRYFKKNGHRQPQMKVQILSI
jgi:large subunit ribosomal protein L21